MVAQREGLTLTTIEGGEVQRYREEGNPFEFSHTLEEQIDRQIAAGFVITGCRQYRSGRQRLSYRHKPLGPGQHLQRSRHD